MKRKLHISQYGVWTLVTKDPSSLEQGSLFKPWGILVRLWAAVWGISKPTKAPLEEVKAGINSGPISDLVSFLKEVYSLGPFYFLSVVTMNVLLAFCGAMSTFFWSRILNSITLCLQNHEVKTTMLIQAMLGRILSSVLHVYLTRMEEIYSVALSERIKHAFLEKTMSIVSKLDPLTAEDPDLRSKTDGASDAILAFLGIKETVASLVVTLAHLALLLGTSRNNLTLVLSIVFCAIHSLLSLARGTPYSSSFVTFCSNPHFKRMKSLKSLAFDGTFLEDRLSHGLENYIIREFRKSRQSLGDVCTEPMQFQWMRSTPITFEVLLELSWDASLIFLALKVLLDPKDISLTEFLAALRASSSMEGLSWRIFWNCTQIHKHLRIVQGLYSLDKIQSHLKDGDTPYPVGSDGENQLGAQIEFRNVTFKYPGSDRTALNEISFTIRPGQLVVIVGVNGSGKSSTIKLLNRLYDPSSGEILLDGLPIASYNLSDLRRSMAILRQNHPVLPVSIRENLALGSADTDMSDNDIQEALRQGGAENFVRELKQGLETVLDPVQTTVVHTVGDSDPELKAVLDNIETKTDISGGESQRLSASRTFVRLMNGNIRLLVVDEPTSALDPEGEYELFLRLRKYSEKKTAIFITHRFGHLTRHADLILCLKDGRLVEQGTHDELIALSGEYKRLYDVQARAFTGGGCKEP